MRMVFCGMAAGTASARVGAYYAGPGNRFWITLREVGLTPVLLAPADFGRLPEFRIGLTDISKTASGSDAEVGSRGVDRKRLTAAIAGVAPAHLAFNGPQPEAIGGASVWVLPSTSGAARGFWDIGPWLDLAHAAN
jgi:TDG/mug DNA glycosylase family protein